LGSTSSAHRLFFTHWRNFQFLSCEAPCVLPWKAQQLPFRLKKDSSIFFDEFSCLFETVHCQFNLFEDGATESSVRTNVKVDITDEVVETGTNAIQGGLDARLLQVQYVSDMFPANSKIVDSYFYLRKLFHIVCEQEDSGMPGVTVENSVQWSKENILNHFIETSVHYIGIHAVVFGQNCIEYIPQCIQRPELRLCPV